MLLIFEYKINVNIKLSYVLCKFFLYDIIQFY